MWFTPVLPAALLASAVGVPAAIGVAPGGGAAAPDSCLTKSTPITWLACQLDASPDLDPGPGQARLINSREGGPWDGVAWLFDQAQAAIAFTAAGDRDRAAQMLGALDILQEDGGGADYGSWCTSYFVNGACRDMTRRSGSTAWVVIAVNYFEAVWRDLGFASMADAALAFLDRIINRDPLSEEFGAVGLGPDLPGVYAAEHQADAYAAYRMRSWLHGGPDLHPTAARLRQFLLGRMASGGCPQSGGYKVWRDDPDDVFNAAGACRPAEYFACPQTFGILALGRPMSGEVDYLAGLDSIWDGGALDMVISDRYRRPPDYPAGPDDVDVVGVDLGANGYATGHVFLIGETTAGYAAADFLFGDGSRAAFLVAETGRLLYPDGGVPYSTDPGLNDPHKAVASTAWAYFNSADPRVNPMNPLDYEVGASLTVVEQGSGVRLRWDPADAAVPVAYDVLRGTRPDGLAPVDRVTGATTWVDPEAPSLAFYAVSVARL